ncbi:MAG TPA: hypothetical protein VFS30_07540 [Dehalococcoidia bacterium]|nr:hypothetical protein [Dehalococcoidia bacterium]
MTSGCAEHDWKALTEDELAAVRKASRQTRPNMAWLESVEQCRKCGAMEGVVSWYGQVQRTEVLQDNEQSRVKWPTRAPAPGGGMSAG